MSATLLLEDGRVFRGRAFGARATRTGELVFHTAMTGYQEILTDPSFTEQLVTFTAPHIGNTGVNGDDSESERVAAAALIVRRLTRRPSSWRASGDLDGWLAAQGVPGIEGIDTRALVRHVREHGAMRAVLCTDASDDGVLAERLRAWPGMQGRALATQVGCSAPWTLCDPIDARLRVTVVDGGVKRSILTLLEASGAAVRVAPITATAEAWAAGADLVLFSNGPGDPAALPQVVEQVRALLGRVPCAGICLGHQLLALALGATTYKLRFGHRGGNQPVRDERTGAVLITSQNHGFAVDRASLDAASARVTHTHLNDGTVSGFEHVGARVRAVQFHPEAGPGPHDGRAVLDDFYRLALETR